MLVLEEVKPSAVLGDEAGEPAEFFGKTPPDESFGLAVETVQQAVDLVTEMHVHFINDPRLLNFWWMFGATSLKERQPQAEVTLMGSFMADMWKVSRSSAMAGKFIGSPWSDEFVGKMDQFHKALPKILDHHYNTEAPFPFTMVHGDYHSANLLRIAAPGMPGRAPESFVVLDFQVCVANVNFSHTLQNFLTLSTS